LGIPAVYDYGSDIIRTLSSHVYNQDKSVNLFNFFDKDGNVIANLNDLLALRVVGIKLIIDNDPNRSPNSLQVSSRATLRNIINGYGNN